MCVCMDRERQTQKQEERQGERGREGDKAAGTGLLQSSDLCRTYVVEESVRRLIVFLVPGWRHSHVRA